MKFLSRYNLIIYSVLIGLLFIFYKGYTFNTADHAEMLPQVYQLHNPNLYPTDFFIRQYNTVFTVRDYFVYFMYGLSLLIPMAPLCFMLTFLAIILNVYFVIKITQKFTDNALTPLLSPILILFPFFNFVVGGNPFQDTSLLPGTLTMPFSLAGIWLFFEGRHKLSFFLIGLGTFFQPLAALQVFGILWVMLVLDKDTRQFKTVAPPTLLYLLPASFMLAPLFYRQFGLQPDYDKELYYNILFRFRNHLHYLPSIFPLNHYIKLFGLIALGFIATRFVKMDRKNLVYQFSALVLIGMLLYWLGLEVLNIHAVGKMQWFKNTMWLNMFACMSISIFIAEKLKGVTGNFYWKAWYTPALSLASIVLFIMLLNSKYLPIEKMQGRYQVGNYQKTDLTLLHEWMEKNLPIDAVILCSPQNTSIGCEAKRNQAVQYQAVIHEPFYMLPWYERFTEIYGVSLETARMDDMREQATQEYYTKQYRGNKYHIDYRIDNIKNCNFAEQLGPVVYQSGDYILTKFIPEQ